jgi:hypothetical protein
MARGGQRTEIVSRDGGRSRMKRKLGIGKRTKSKMRIRSRRRIGARRSRRVGWGECGLVWGD